VSRLLAAALFLLACNDEVEPPDSDGGASCRALFGEAPVYRDCGGDADGCAFHSAGAWRTCGAICADLGGACEASYRTQNGCDRASGDLGCEHPSNEIICVCLR